MANKNYMGIVPLIFACLGILSGYLIYARNLPFLCSGQVHAGCLLGTDAARNIGEPLFIYSLLILPIGLLYSFVKRARKSIRIFSAIWLPLSAALIAFTPTVSGTWMPLYFIGKDALTWLLAILFLIISLILIALKSFSKKPS